MRIYEGTHQPKTKSPNYCSMHLVGGTTSEAQDFHPTTCQDRYRVMYYNVLGTVVTSSRDRFNQSSCVVCNNNESSLLKTIKVEDTSDESDSIKLICIDEINIKQLC